MHLSVNLVHVRAARWSVGDLLIFCEGGSSSTAITAKTLPSGTAAVVRCVREFPAL